MIHSLLARPPRLFVLNFAALLGVFGVLVSPAPTVFAQSRPVFSQMIVFGDSLSDDGNIAHRMRDTFFFSYPSSNFDYSNYRFTDDLYTSPGSSLYNGAWHEQLARSFLNLAVARNSLDGGMDYAFGGATTRDGQTERTIINNPFPFSGGNFTITIDK